VVPAFRGGWNVLGFKPDHCPADRGDEARISLRRRFSIRLHPALIASWPDCEQKGLLIAALEKLADPDEIWKLLKGYPEDMVPRYLRTALPELDEGSISRYPDDSGWFITGMLSQPADRSKRHRITLRDHCQHVQQAVRNLCSGLLDGDLRDALVLAAQFHDYGKIDVRYQSWLRDGDELAARYAPTPIAKSGKYVLKKQRDCGVPPGFRHESLSLMFAERAIMHEDLRQLVLHLIAAHHGEARPSLPVVLDDSPECVAFEGLSVCRRDRLETPPHSLAAGVEDRFWSLTRQFGWWGLAYLEAMLRLADWRASESEGAEFSL
jgi:CRISPR-associated endonuclease/helicase Cas3